MAISIDQLKTIRLRAWILFKKYHDAGNKNMAFAELGRTEVCNDLIYFLTRNN